jgi:hypothetical protein
MAQWHISLSVSLVPSVDEIYSSSRISFQLQIGIVGTLESILGTIESNNGIRAILNRLDLLIRI